MGDAIIYPGTFDPVTHGHIHIVERASKLFNHIIIAVAKDNQKKSLLDFTERVMLTERVFSLNSKVEVCGFTGLLVDFVRTQETRMILRSMRSMLDFEYEYRIATANQAMLAGLESIFLLPDPSFAHISSTLVREIRQLNGDISPFVPPEVVDFLQH